MLRPLNCVMIGFAVIVGEFVSKPSHISALPTVFGFLTGFFVCAYSMVVNDIYDVAVDVVNQPRRPIPSVTTLQQTYGIARGTVRKAVALLADEGLVVLSSSGRSRGWACIIPGQSWPRPLHAERVRSAATFR